MTVDAMDVQTAGEESSITYQQLTDMEREFDEVETDTRKWQTSQSSHSQDSPLTIHAQFDTKSAAKPRSLRSATSSSPRFAASGPW